ncbi:MAG: hypothetical protein AB1450_08355 [Pseudomonadota bacterium]
MSKADLVADLKASLHDAADIFTAANDADFERHIDVAALAMGSKRPRTLLGSVTLSADVMTYLAPDDIVAPKFPIWGVNERNRYRQYERGYPGQLPRLSLVGGELHLTPAPTAAQIAALGATYKFYYYAAHQVAADAAQTTIRAGDRGLLLLRAQAEAMRELAVRNSGKPVAMRDGMSGQPRNATPAALYRELLDEFEAAS